MAHVFFVGSSSIDVYCFKRFCGWRAQQQALILKPYARLNFSNMCFTGAPATSAQQNDLPSKQGLKEALPFIRPIQGPHSVGSFTATMSSLDSGEDFDPKRLRILCQLAASDRATHNTEEDRAVRWGVSEIRTEAQGLNTYHASLNMDHLRKLSSSVREETKVVELNQDTPVSRILSVDGSDICTAMSTDDDARTPPKEIYHPSSLFSSSSPSAHLELAALGRRWNPKDNPFSLKVKPSSVFTTSPRHQPPLLILASSLSESSDTVEKDSSIKSGGW